MLVVSWFCPTGRLGSPMFLCRTSRYHIVHCTMDNLYEGRLKQAAFNDTCMRSSNDSYCMRSSNDKQVDSKVELDTLGVVDMDTSIIPDVFGLRAFDRREPMVWVLPGDFSNTVRVLVPDATATPVGFHDVMIENLSNTPDYRSRLVSARDITSLRRRCIGVRLRWRRCVVPVNGSMIVNLVEVEPVLASMCSPCALHVLFNLSRHIMDYHLELGQLRRGPVEWCSVWKGTAQDCVDHLRG